MYTCWKLTDEEIARVNEWGGSITEAQEAKREAYIKAGGVILNPDALEDMYEALKGIFEAQELDGNRVVGRTVPSSADVLRMKQALAKAEG